ncbi:MAG TPA: carboxymuconolactone decarboxylase family protein [Roseiflexaceae bacterium]|nr:carboxymuconolactone decarboxylase family protein [Roseiflexaceae bacterium]
MTRLDPVDPTTATGKARTLLDAVQSNLGKIPNMMRTMALSPAVLEGYLGLNTALAGGVLNAHMREQIALAVAEVNRCGYCLAAHTHFGKQIGLNADALERARKATATDSKAAAALTFVRMLVEQHGTISDDDLRRVRQAGYGDAEIAEMIAHVALNIFTNYLNLVAQTEVDFPPVELHLGARRAA